MYVAFDVFRAAATPVATSKFDTGFPALSRLDEGEVVLN
jgi:hypothetical protein